MERQKTGTYSAENMSKEAAFQIQALGNPWIDLKYAELDEQPVSASVLGTRRGQFQPMHNADVDTKDAF